MRILAIADVESKFIYDFFNPNNFKDIDLVIAAGDLNRHYLSYVATVIPVPLLYIYGNHDGKLLYEPPGGCICIDNEVYEYKGLRIAGLGGCMRYTGGTFQYTEKQMKSRIKKNWLKYRKGIDILVTHSPALGLGDGHDRAHVGFQCFLDLMEKYEPQLMIHGHQHKCYGHFEKKHHHHQTTIVNAYDYAIYDFDEKKLIR